MFPASLLSFFKDSSDFITQRDFCQFSGRATPPHHKPAKNSKQIPITTIQLGFPFTLDMPRGYQCLLLSTNIPEMVKIRSYKLSFRNISPAFQRLWTEICQKASLSSWAEFSTQGFKAPSPRYSAASSLLLLKQMLIFGPCFSRHLLVMNVFIDT